jgi:hypothetical protein
MIKNIKIFGERNSGTRFLMKLIQSNITDINLYTNSYYGSTGWKHGFPRLERFNNPNETLFIFIIRDLDEWLISMYNNPYHFIRPKSIDLFISEPLHISESRWLDHDVNINIEEHQNIIDLRYAKIKSYLRLFNKVSNAIFINLGDLQQNNTKFLQFIKHTYSLNITEPFTRVDKHTNDAMSCTINRTYDTILPIIHNKNMEIEEMVASLKKAYRFKKSNTPSMGC